MSIGTNVNDRISVWPRACLLGLIALFVVIGAMRLNDCDLFNPDSPRYLIYSQAIVKLGAYRATDIPGSPIYSWRPPGLSILLAPILAFKPYDDIAAKWFVLLTGGLLLWMVFELTAMNAGNLPALLVTAVVATAPAFLVMSTEILTEVPYTLFAMIVLVLLGRSTSGATTDGVIGKCYSPYLVLGLGTAFLAFTPWLRTAGVALVAAVGIWSLLSRPRLQWLLSVAVAAAGLGLLAWRNKQAAGENYVGSLLGRLRERGIGPMFSSGLDSIWFYLSAAPGLFLPGLTTDRPWFAPLTLEPLPNLGLPMVVTAGIGILLLVLSLSGMWIRRDRGGSLVLLYLVIYCACLVVWPWRHERFLWPLVPVLLAFVPASFGIAGRFTMMKRVFSVVIASWVIAFVGWQSLASVQLASVNREFVRNRDEFHATRFPGFYFSDWRGAGDWLRENSSPHARVLTWHASVAASSHRFQKRCQFETMTPDKLRKEIEAFSARYLVVPSGQFGDGFGWRQLTADPEIRLNIVYRERDVTVLEIVPNRTGEVSKTDYSDWLDRQIQLIEDARQRLPARIDLAIRHASLLRENGRGREAIPILRDLIERGTVTVRVCSELGWMLFDSEEFADAAKFLDMARKLPNAESIASVLAEGAERARERLREKSYGLDARSIESRLRRIKGLMVVLKYTEAECEADSVLAENPKEPEANFLRGRLHHLCGEVHDAETCYERALQYGSADARQPLILLRVGDAMTRDSTSTIVIGDYHESVEPNDPETHVRWAALFQEQGWSGRALATLENASQKFGGQSVIKKPLADLYLKFSRPDLALPLYESLVKDDPHSEAIQRGGSACLKGLREPEL